MAKVVGELIMQVKIDSTPAEFLVDFENAVKGADNRADMIRRVSKCVTRNIKVFKKPEPRYKRVLRWVKKIMD